MEDFEVENASPSVSPERSLTPKVPAHLLQGVPFRCLLAGGGRPFRRSHGRATRHLRPCSAYDIFVSHDWQTSGWLKYASLLVLFNSQAAAIATLVVSITTGVLIAYEVLPNHSLAMSIGYFVFVIFFFFWQNIRDMFFMPKLAFLDKLTIPQDNEELKEQCILGLAGFLDRSRKLVVLFSDKYIGRLWCIYEFTAFVRNGTGDVQTVPVVLPLLLLLHATWWFAVKLLIFLVFHTSDASRVMKLVVSIFGMAVMFLITYPLQAWVGRQLIKNLQSLSKQLRQFDIHQTKCSCCSADHLKFGERIPCDRDLIYQSLAEWYGLCDDGQTNFESFNKAVRTQFADQILSTWSRPLILPLDLFIYTVFSVNTPFLITRLPDAILQAQQEPSAFVACIVAMRVLIASWGHVWPAMLLYLWACKTMWALSLQYDQWPILIGVSSAVFVLCSWGLASGLCVFSVWFTPDDSWPPLLVFVLVTAVIVLLLRVSTVPTLGAVNKGEETPTDFKHDAQSIRDDASSFSI